MTIAQLRQKYHQQICREIIRAPKGYPNFADGSNKSSCAIAWGIVNCVYHFALPELEASIKDIKNEDQLDILKIMVDGRRLRDISDLPFDLAI